MNVGLSDRIRSLARAKYVGPAIRAGKNKFPIRVRDIFNDLQAEAEGFPSGHTPQICSALRTSKFLRENGLEIEAIDGPPSKQSPTVIFHFRIKNADKGPKSAMIPNPVARVGDDEDPSTRAKRLTEKLRGLLKKELAEYGGGEAFLRWVRGNDEEDAA